MKVFKLKKVERATCYNALNSANGREGYRVNSDLFETKEIMDAVSKGMVEVDHGNGSFNINFEGCDEDEDIRMRRGHVDRLIGALKKTPWPSARDGFKAMEIVKTLEDAPDDKTEQGGPA